MTKPAKQPATKAKADEPHKPVPAHELMLSPAVQNAAAMLAWSKHVGEADINDLLLALLDKTKAVTTGDMKPVEAMLYGQAAALQSIFTNLARRAAGQEYLKQFQTYMTLALKAQAQCRATLQALAEIKNPRPVQFVGQANIAQGPQQVNNGAAPPVPAAQEKTATLQNKLMDTRHGAVDGHQSARHGSDRALPSSVLGPVACSHGFQDLAQRLERRALADAARADPAS